MRKDSESVDLAILEDLGEHAESYVRSKYAPEVAEEILKIITEKSPCSEPNSIRPPRK